VCAHLIDILIRFRNVREMIRAVTKNFSQLALTFTLLLALSVRAACGSARVHVAPVLMVCVAVVRVSSICTACWASASSTTR
jgi:hypothetical protein